MAMEHVWNIDACQRFWMRLVCGHTPREARGERWEDVCIEFFYGKADIPTDVCSFVSGPYIPFDPYRGRERERESGRLRTPRENAIVSSSLFTKIYIYICLYAVHTNLCRRWARLVCRSRLHHSHGRNTQKRTSQNGTMRQNGQRRNHRLP